MDSESWQPHELTSAADSNRASWATDIARAARDGGRRIAVLVGEPGIGKTRLIGEVRESLGDFLLLDVLCQEQEQGIPFSLLRALVRSAHNAHLDPADELRAAAVLDAASLLPVDAPPVQSIYALFEDFVRGLCAHGPVALLVDDAHLGDEESITAVSLLSRHSGMSRLLVVCSTRSEPMSNDSRVISTIGRMVDGPGGELHELDRMQRAELAALVAEELGAPADDHLVEVVEKYSLGNPLFAIAAVQLLGQRSRIVRRRNRAYLTDENAGAGMTQRGALLHRLFMQDQSRRTVARIIAIFGPVSLEDTPVLDEIARLPEGEVEEAFDGLIEAGILEARADGDYFFQHPLVGEMLLEDIGPLERKHLHKDLAKALARTGDPHYVQHLVLGADRGDEAAIEAALANAASMAATRPLSAAQWYEQALKILKPSDLERRVQSMLGQLTAYWKGSRPRRAVAVGLAALEICDDPRLRTSIHSVVIGASYSMGEWPDSARLAKVAIAEFPDDPRFVAQLAASLATQGLRDELMPHLQRMRAIAAEKVAPLDEVSMSFFGFVGSTVGDREIFDYATEGLAAVVQQGLADGAPSSRAIAAAESLAYLYAQTGNVLATRTLLASVDRASVDARLDIGGQRTYAESICLASEGNWDQALTIIRSAAVDLEFAEQRSNLAWLTLLEGQIELRKGNASAVVELLSGPTPYPHESRGHRVGEVILEKARAVLECRKVDTERVAAIGTSARESGWYAADLYASFTGALLGEPDTSSEFRDRVAQLSQDPGFPDATLAHDLLERHLNHPDGAAEVIADAVQHGSLSWVALDALVPSLKQRKQAPATKDGDELSDDDLQMIRLVRDGLNNRQIAEVIHFSRKTVEARLSRLYRLFDCRSRIELVVEASRRGLFDSSQEDAQK